LFSGEVEKLQRELERMSEVEKEITVQNQTYGKETVRPVTIKQIIDA